MLKAIKSFFLAIKYCFPRTPGIRYYRHEKNKHLYILASEKYIKPGEENKFNQLFPSAIRCSLFRFNFIHLYYNTEIVTVADDEIIDEFHPETNEQREARIKQETEIANRINDFKKNLKDGKLKKLPNE